MIEFPCGCKFEQDNNGNVIFDPVIKNLSLDCSRTWDLISSGNTKGVFQLESQLGQSKSRDSKPRSILELSDLIAIIRPGTLHSMLNGKSLTQHYIDRKSGKDEVTYLHPALKPILKDTYGVFSYQEQAIKIAQVISGFDLQQADSLRRACGKKSASLMAKVKIEFIDGAKKTGIVNKEDAAEIFGWIKESQNYLFNKSHSVSYAMNGYQTAYAKAHFPKAFFTSYLRHADGKPKPFDEVNELVNNARLMDIEVCPPSVLNMNANFELIDNKPTFGLTNVKRMGMTAFIKMKKFIDESNYDLKSMTWEQFLMRIGRCIKKDSFEFMIKAGVFDCYGESRAKMVYQYSIYKELKDKQKDFLTTDSAVEFTQGLMNLIVHLHNSKRKSKFTIRYIELAEGYIVALNNPPYKLVDTCSWIAKQERELLGAELTCSEVDDYNSGSANCTCREYHQGFQSKSIAIAARVDDIREWTIRGGKNAGSVMAFLKLSDASCYLDNNTIFADAWMELSDEIQVGNIMLLRGSRDKSRDSFLIKRATRLSPLRTK